MKNAEVSTVENLLYDRQDLDIRWRITTLCNYQCDFCIQGNNRKHILQAKGESSRLSEEICDRLVCFMESQPDDRRIKVSLIGGEVTILKSFPMLFEKLVMCDFPGSISFDLTTNFSEDAAFFCDLCDIIQSKAKWKKRSLSLLTSFYPEYVTSKEFTDKLIEVCLHAKQNDLKSDDRVHFSMGVPMLRDEDYSEMLRIRSILKGYEVNVQPIIIRNYNTQLSDEVLGKIVKTRGSELRVTDIHEDVHFYRNIRALGAALEDKDSFDPRGYLCDAGICNFWVDAFGNVKRCPTIGSTMSMGNILDGSFLMLEKPDICTCDHCSCTQFGKISKPDPGTLKSHAAGAYR